MQSQRRTYPKFGVTRYQNGECLVQKIYPIGNQMADSKTEFIGVFPDVSMGNDVYMQSNNGSQRM